MMAQYKLCIVDFCFISLEKLNYTLLMIIFVGLFQDLLQTGLQVL